MSYELAPATQLVATHCCVCHRPLVDAVSVEMGIGPDCRKRYFKAAMEEQEVNRPAANKIVHALAVGTVEVAGALVELTLLGFTALAARMAERLAAVTLTQVNRSLNGGLGWNVSFSYDPTVINAIKGIWGRRWDADEKAWFIPEGSKKQLWGVLRAHFAGKMGLGPKGVFLVT